MELHEVIKKRRGELGMSQADLAAAAGVDRRQVRRYEAGEQQPVLSVAVAIAHALGITVNELAGQPAHRIDLSGTWWMTWQTSRGGEEAIAAQQVSFAQQEELIHLDTMARGLSVEAGGYHWRGELRLWDQEVLMGWYVANDGPVRSKGTLYFVLHPHGISMSGRWVGLGFDGKVMTGWGTAARTKDEAVELNTRLREDRGTSL
ncbi:helix-turn-helix transcriptional regulator [Streptomyces sp. NBC_01381]|uniref:helix-turn-helix transcriptional regulator n=1 Tax=Streptomyces sp. NBC_01381 TaxID=2903845 RepID=UPI00224D529A|nr:helix-turn-helix transcriptional regulator [Streptomyces sp. NBC_01381]MCX4672858.1 helix-turn-helix transcriptional regulator [Streptomyces sp. NBC_01381]